MIQNCVYCGRAAELLEASRWDVRYPDGGVICPNCSKDEGVETSRLPDSRGKDQKLMGTEGNMLMSTHGAMSMTPWAQTARHELQDSFVL